MHRNKDIKRSFNIEGKKYVHDEIESKVISFIYCS